MGFHGFGLDVSEILLPEFYLNYIARTQFQEVVIPGSEGKIKQNSVVMFHFSLCVLLTAGVINFDTVFSGDRGKIKKMVDINAVTTEICLTCNIFEFSEI